MLHLAESSQSCDPDVRQDWDRVWTWLGRVSSQVLSVDTVYMVSAIGFMITVFQEAKNGVKETLMHLLASILHNIIMGGISHYLCHDALVRSQPNPT